MTTSLVISPDVGYVFLSVAAVVLHYSYVMSYAVFARRKHKISYPDMGCGIYSAKLEKVQWLEFNNAQRVHYNYLEDLPCLFALILIAGVQRPLTTTALTAIYIFGRQLYTHYYTKIGPEARYSGFFIYKLSLLAMLVVSIYNGLELTKLI